MDWCQLILGGKIGACIIIMFVAIQHDKARLFYYYIFNFTLAFSLANFMRMFYA